MSSLSYRPRRILPGILLLAFFAGCSSIKVTQDFTAGTDFTAYRTFALMPAAELEARFGASPLDASARSYIEAALQRELVARGLRLAGAAQPDLTVAYAAGRHKAIAPGDYGRSYEYSGGNAQAVEIHKEVDEGALLVDLVDARTGRLVWRGEGKGKPSRQGVDAAAAAILAQYPPADR